MSRADELAAKAKIEAAIEEYRTAYAATHPDSIRGTTVDWIVVCAATKPDLEDPDEDVTAYDIIVGNNAPWYRGMGLLDAGRHYMLYNTGPTHETDLE